MYVHVHNKIVMCIANKKAPGTYIIMEVLSLGEQKVDSAELIIYVFCNMIIV